ncbi:Uma2 family endonuclease [Streptomyces rimosus]|uniref:Uma2 family endonuclease n=1 Tax=Streptomyces rimosus TaxID=1927 RepID=UPI0037BD89A0
MTDLWDEGAETDLRQVLWRVRMSLELPEGFRTEIIEADEGSGRIDISRTAPYAHGRTANRLRNAFSAHLHGSPYADWFGIDIIDGHNVWRADTFIALTDDVENGICEYGVAASEVRLVAEVVAPGREDQERDRIRKRRAYARAGIPVYLLIDDFTMRGTVTVLTGPRPAEATYAAEHRVPYGTDITIPEGPAKGFVIDETITGPPRGDR